MKKRDPINWSHSRATESEYERTLREVGALAVQQAQGANSPAEISAALERLTTLPRFESWAQERAFRMVKSLVVRNARTWREAADRGTNARIIHQLLKQEFENHSEFQQIIQQNATYIKRLPTELAQHVSQLASKEAIAGRRGAEVVREIHEKLPHLAKWKARLIARTEISKSQAAIVEVRAREVGCTWATWQTSKDQRVRKSHKLMQGVIFSFDDLPSPEHLAHEPSALGNYAPGNCPNCRCFSSVIVYPEKIEGPLKVYSNGAIRAMMKSAFLKLVGN